MGFPFHFGLLGSMVLSIILGVVAVVVGAMLKTSIGSWIEDYISDIDDKLKDLKPALENAESGNLIPYVSKVPDGVDWQAGSAGSLIIVAGALVVLCSLYGIFAAWKRSPPLIFVLIAVLIVVAIMEAVFLTIISSSDGAIFDGVKDNLADYTKKKYTLDNPSDFAKVLNSIMIVGKCCGVSGPSDFKNLTLEGKVVQFHIPPACCDVEGLSKDIYPGRARLEILSCATTELEENPWYFKQGCFEKVWASIADENGMLVLIILLFLIIVHVIQVIIGVLVVLFPFESELKEEVKAEEIVVKKKFVPFSKISSFVSSDISRIKSTEIW